MLSEKEILHAFSSDQDMMTILQIIYDLQLKDSWLCAGSVRNFIWNILSMIEPEDSALHLCF